MGNHYTVGNDVTVTGTFTNSATKAPVDPTDARVDVLDPKNRVNTYAYTGGAGPVKKSSTGVYTYDIDTTGLPGVWQYRWWSPPGTAQTAGASSFIVDPWPAARP